MKRVICKNCNCAMELGYLSKTGMPGHDPRIYWHNGNITYGWLLGYRSNSDKKLQVRSYCCPKCQKIELYAESSGETNG